VECDGCRHKGHEYICEQCKDRFTVQASNLESAISNGPVAKKKSPKCNKIFSVSVHHRTNRLADSDGRSIKAALDACVLGGLLPDDSPKFLPQIPGQTQERTSGKEETIIEISWRHK